MEWSGPATRPGLDIRHLIIEGHRGPLDFGFGTWIWDLDLGPGFGTWIWDLDLGLDLGLKITFRLKHFLRIKIPDDPIPANQSTHMDKNRRTE